MQTQGKYILQKYSHYYQRAVKRQKYLAAHLYPDDTVEISTSNDWPEPIQKGLDWRTEIWKKIHIN